jgi:hypothetical protein
MPDYVQALAKLDALRDYGFVPSGFYPLPGVGLEDRWLRLGEFDGVFVRA